MYDYTDDDKDLLELQLIESFRKLKIIDLPRFSPTIPQKKIQQKVIQEKPKQENTNLFDKDGNIESHFFSRGLGINKTPKNIFDKVFKIITFPTENKDFDNDPPNSEDNSEEEEISMSSSESDKGNENDYDFDDNDDDENKENDDEDDDENKKNYNKCDDENKKNDEELDLLEIRGEVVDDSDHSNDDENGFFINYYDDDDEMRCT